MPTRRARSHLQLHVPDRHPESAEAPWTWVWRAGDRTEAGAGPLERAPEATEVTLVVPVSRVSMHRVTLPAGSRTALRRVLPLAVEESLAIAPEDAHVVAAGTIADKTLAAVVERRWLQEVLDTLDRARRMPARTVMEGELVARHDRASANWRLLRHGTAMFVHVGHGEAVALDLPPHKHAGPPLALKLLVDEARDRNELPERILSSSIVAPGLVAQSTAIDAPAWSRALGVAVEPAPDLPLTALDARDASLTDLLQGSFATGADAATWMRALRWPAIAAAALVVAHTSLLAIDVWRMQGEADALNESMRANFRDAFPEATTIVDPALQMSRNLESLRRAGGRAAPDDLLVLLGSVGPKLDAISARARSVRYDGRALELELEVPGALSAGALVERLQDAATTIRVERAAVRPDGTRALVRVQGRAT